MNPSTKAALKARVHQYEGLQKTLNFRGAGALERTEQKCAYLEDLLRLYTQEVESLASDKARLMQTNELDLSREISILTEKNYLLSQQLAAQHETNARLLAEKQSDVDRAAANFGKQLTRHQERSAVATSTLQNENQILKAKIDQLQALANDQKALQSAEDEVRVAELQYRIEDLHRELINKTDELTLERDSRSRLETDLAFLRQQQFHMSNFIDELEFTVGLMTKMRKDSSDQATQIVESLLRSSQALLQRHVTAIKEADQVAASRAGLGPAEGNATTGAPGQGKGGDATLKLSETTRLLKERLERGHKRAVDTSAVSEVADDDVDGGNGRSGGARPLSQKLADAIAKLQVALDAQAVEVTLAAKVALDAHEATLKETQQRLLNSYAQCEHLIARTSEMERQCAETKELCATDRDRALNLRDQAVLQLRTRDLRDSRKLTRNVETQTLHRIGGDDHPAANPVAAATGALAPGGKSRA